jgi:hypothetical protein
MGFIYDWTNGRLGDRKPVSAAPADGAAKPAEAAK